MVESRSRDPQLASDWSVPRAVNRWRRCVMRSLVRTERKYKYGAHIICSVVRVGGAIFTLIHYYGCLSEDNTDFRNHHWCPGGDSLLTGFPEVLMSKLRNSTVFITGQSVDQVRERIH